LGRLVSTLTVGMGVGVTPAGVLDRGYGGGGALHQGPEKYVGQEKPNVTFKILLNIQMPRHPVLRPRADPGAQRPPDTLPR
jgi:hypothetical protein